MAAALLQEAMWGTPRAPAAPSKQELSVPLPETIQAPAIVLQHSLKAVHEPPAGLVPRYDYMSEAQMATAMQAADAGRSDGEADGNDDPDEVSLVPELLLARRRLKGTADGWDYLVRWQGLGEEHDTWVPEDDLDPDFIRRDMEAAETERSAGGDAE